MGTVEANREVVSLPYDLPDRWTWASLGDVVDIGSEQVLPSLDPSMLFNYVALENLESGTGRLIGFSPTVGSRIASGKYKFTNEHVLYGKLRPYLRKAMIPEFSGVSSTDLLPLRPKERILDRRFLARWLLSPFVLEYVVGHQTGVKMPRLRTKDLEAMPVPLPPLDDQRRIAELLEGFLAQSCETREALNRIFALLKHFRQEVLEAAFRGELTERNPGDEPASVLLKRIREERRRDWEIELRANGKDPCKAKRIEAEYPDTSSLPRLPEGWVWTTFDSIMVGLKNGLFSGSPFLEPPGIAILHIGAVRPMSVNLSEPRYLRITPTPQTARATIENGDLLFTRYNGSLELVGVCGMVRNPPRGMIYPDKLIRARVPTKLVLPQYLEAYFSTSVPRHYIQGKAKSSAGQQGISGRDLRGVPVALPPLSEQRQIVAKIDALFALVTSVTSCVAVARDQIEQMDQGVQRRAFRGEL